MAISLAEARPELGITATEPLPNGVFKRTIRVRDVLGSWEVQVLDEQVVSGSEDIVRVRQFIRGQYNNAFARNWKKHNDGWQGAESIREFSRRRVAGTSIIREQEINVSGREYVF